MDPYSIEEIEAGLERLLRDAPLRAELVAKGLRRAGELTWGATVEQTLNVYRGLAG
ncbi:glycosyltransferase involved in cell wall biosynthesis [Paraburkholderia sp. GAS448]|uniref:hypothetical protein n=1 Tax=Paraburkholderia sp. GAS448 TaxID=3035136 RepID=UPI003D1FA3C8